jgi:hypothetical protein
VSFTLLPVPPRHVQVRWVLGLTAALIVGAAVVGFVFSFGRDVAPEFYTAASQIIPVLLIAVLLELAVLHRGLGCGGCGGFRGPGGG